jgi:hypothetical protein
VPTERARFVGVVNAPLTFSQPPAVGALEYVVAVANVIAVDPSELATETCVP